MTWLKATDLSNIPKKTPHKTIAEAFERKRLSGIQSSMPKWARTGAIPPSSTDPAT